MSIPNIPEASVSPPDQVTPVKDEPSITADGEPLKPLIVGVKVRYQRSIEDARGEVTEVYRASWGVNDDPLVSRVSGGDPAGRHQGVVIHQRQEDRLFHIMGTVHWVLYDDEHARTRNSRVIRPSDLLSEAARLARRAIATCAGHVDNAPIIAPLMRWRFQRHRRKLRRQRGLS